MNNMENNDPDQAAKERAAYLRAKRGFLKPEWAVIGSRLKTIREAKGLTQKELADLFVVKNGQGQVSSLEKGRFPAKRHTRRNYVQQLGASPEYIESGMGPMFLPESKKDEGLTATMMIETVTSRTSGNMRMVSRKGLGQFLNNEYAPSFPYPFVTGDCYSFPVDTFDFGYEFPFDAQVICTRLFSHNTLLLGKVYVFQTENQLLVRQYSGLIESGQHYRLTTPHNSHISLPVNELRYLYYIERIDKPVI